MECVNLLTIQKKRRLEAEVGTRNNCQPKRVCVGVGLCDQMTCPMETSWRVDSATQQQQQTATVQAYTTVGTLLDASMACPRCLSGEPGHINHILGC